MKIAFFSTQSYDRAFFDKINENFKQEITYFSVALNQETWAIAEGFPAICVFVNDQVNVNIIEKLASKGLKYIALRCAGFNNVDLQTAQKFGIKVVRVPAYSPYAVAEHTVALILSLNRKIHKAFNRVREGNFSLEKLTGFDLFGKTVGVIGTGKIGAAFCRIMLGFGTQVLAYDKFENEELKTQGVKYVHQDDLFQNADIISLHCPLTPETMHLIDSQTISKMKKGVMLINTSRGKLIDTKAVIEALKTGQIAYLGLDVYEQEETLFFKDLSETVIQDDTIARLMSFPNVLITAHQAFFTENALTQIAQTTLQNLNNLEKGLKCENELIFES